MNPRNSNPTPSSGLVGKIFHRPYLFGLVLSAIGAVLIWGGARLLLAGGSPYYALAGLAMAASGILVITGRRLGATVYSLMMLATVSWAIWESGFDPWALAPRIIAPAVLWLWFVMPWTSRRLQGGPRIGITGLALGVVAAVAIGSFAHATFGEPRPDPIVQAGTESEAPVAVTGDAPPANAEWTSWGGTPAGTRFSTLDQITPQNVSKLRLAWVYRFGPAPEGAPRSLEGTPLKVGDYLYLCNDYNDVVSLDAETGKERWRHRSLTDPKAAPYGHCRGVAYYKVPGAEGKCAERIYTNTLDARLLAVDAATGESCPDFGKDGVVDLTAGQPKAPTKGYYFATSAPTLARGRIVLGGWVYDGQYWGEPSGVIRAFDAVTGQLSWAWDVGHPDRTGEPPAGETYTPGTPNAWAPMSVDENMGLVFAPLGGATPDSVAAQRRPFDNEWSGTVVALDAETGRPRWKFQTVHVDRWDYDVPSQPALIDFPTDKGPVPAVLQATKRGEVFVLNRATGEPLVPVTERAVPTDGTAPGESVPATQPFSDAMPSFRGADLTEGQMWGLTPIDQMLCRLKFREARYEGPLTPPGMTPSLLYPGFLGGSNWGSVSVDPELNLAYFNTNYVANYVEMFTRAAADALGVRPDGMGGQPKPEGVAVVPQLNTPYAARSWPFMSPLFVPCQQPPWGKLSAIDLKTRKLLWSIPLGTGKDSGPLGVPSRLPFTIGVPNLGGAISTRGGLVFIGATQDHYLRAFDSRTGKEVWRSRLDAGPQATPMTYMSAASGRQFVVIAAGGHFLLGTTHGDYVYGFSLPKEDK